MSLIVSSLHVYPVKSMGGIELAQGEVTSRGLRHDRRWMLIDDQGTFLSQRSLPQMARFRLAIEGRMLWVQAPDGARLPLPLEPDHGDLLRVTIWDDTCDALHVDPAADQWFSEHLGASCRLVYMPEASQRTVDPRYQRGGEIVSFADGYPFLMISEASLADLNHRLEKPVPMDRFRPNLVIRGGVPYVEDKLRQFRIGSVTFFGAKPCARCQVITTDQATAQRFKEPLATLNRYRRSGHKVLFGMNLLHQGKGILTVGSPLEQD